jgi:hypothetical protein
LYACPIVTPRYYLNAKTLGKQRRVNTLAETNPPHSHQ